MLKALLRKQLLEMTAFLRRSSKTGRQRSRAGAAAFALLFGLLLLVMAACFAMMAWPLCTVLVPRGLSWVYFASMALTALFVSVAASAFMSHSALFQAKDTEMLLSLPIPPGAVFAIRAGGVYLTGLVYLLLAWVPAVACYGITAPHPLAGLAASVPMALSLALVSAVLSILLGWAVAVVSARTRHKSGITVVFSLGFLLIYFWGFRKIEGMLDTLTMGALLSDGQAEIPRNILYLPGHAAEGDPAALAVWLAAVLAVSAVFYRAFSRHYLAALTDRRGTPRAQKQAAARQKTGVRQALLRRELLHLGSSPSYMLNASLGTLMLPLVGLAALWKMDVLRGYISLLPEGMGPLAVCGLACAGAGANLLTAPSVSLEGKTLWLMQSLPVTPQQVLRAKLDLHLLLTALPALFCAGCLLPTVGGSFLENILILLLTALFVLLTAELGLTLGLLLPDLHWTSEGAVVKRGGASVLSLMSGWCLVLAMEVVLYLLSSRIGTAPAMAVCAALFGAADALLHRWLNGPGAKRLEELT